MIALSVTEDLPDNGLVDFNDTFDVEDFWCEKREGQQRNDEAGDAPFEKLLDRGVALSSSNLKAPS